MRIGEFAKAAGIPASVLRHYDKEGLLVPDCIDSFTGYRHYSADQIETVRRISLLKKAGFSLKEIRQILESPENQKLKREMLRHHEAECRTMLGNLQEAEKVMLEKNETAADGLQEKSGITEETKGTRVCLKSEPSKAPLKRKEFQKICDLLEQEAMRRDYQRISGFGKEPREDGTVCVVIEAVKLERDVAFMSEDIRIPFENDEQVVGKWRVLREYAVKDDFFSKLSEGWESSHGGVNRVIYFLPDGESYWIYGWTKNYLLLNYGNQQCRCRYEIEEHDGKRYMFVEEKGYEFRRGGMPTILVLEQADTRAYSKQEIQIKDDLNIPFERDERVLGTWKAYDCIRRKEDFKAGLRRVQPQALFFKKIHFEENGVLTSWYDDAVIGPDRQSWTKGYVLRAYNDTACAYEIVTIDGTDYMFIEWKSGDYRFGGYVTNYYVMQREAC